MGKIRKLCIVLSLLLVLSFLAASPAFATQLINNTNVTRFEDAGSLKVKWRVDGVPVTPLDKGTLTVTLQRYSGSWVNITSKTVTEYNTTKVDNDRDCSVAISGNYRLKMVFTAKDGDETDSLTRYCGSISID